jgi:3-oxoacyl-[acyl-carrier-protein] synthase-3
MRACLEAIEYYLPERVLTNADLASEYPEWPVAKIREKTGIDRRHIAGAAECASDLAVAAARRLLASGACAPGAIDYVILCTQAPDYFLPSTACLVQERLGLSTGLGAFDFNLGCSGFVYGLGLARGLIETDQARCVLLLTAETYSKFLSPRDRGSRTIFGDAAAATLIRGDQGGTGADGPALGPFVFGTDGRGAPHLIVRAGGLRQPHPAPPGAAAAEPVNSHELFMNGPEIFNFTLRVVPPLVAEVLARGGVGLDDIDLFVFHQANKFMLDHIRNKIGIPADRFYISLSDCGNTVSSTIPIALRRAQAEGRLEPGHRVLVVGFGVGYSWAAALVRWTSR